MRENARIIVADDDPAVLDCVTRGLRNSGFTVFCAKDGATAYGLAVEAGPAAILADVDMPGLNGMSLCRMLRRDPRTRAVPLLLMSGALIEERHQVSGLEAGADDYICKPVSLPVLRARLRALIRRGEREGGGAGLLECAGVRVDLEARSVFAGGRPVRLTLKEFDLLAALLRRPGKVWRSVELLEQVWGYDPAEYNDPHTLQSHLSSLRGKLGPRAGRRLVSERGLGYKFDPLPGGDEETRR